MSRGPHCVFARAPAFYGPQAGAAAPEMARDRVEVAQFEPEKVSGLGRNILVASAVKAVLPDPLILAQCAGQRVRVCMLGNRQVVRSIEHRDLRELGKEYLAGPHQLDSRRIVQRRHVAKSIELLEKVRVDFGWLSG